MKDIVICKDEIFSVHVGEIGLPPELDAVISHLAEAISGDVHAFAVGDFQSLKQFFHHTIFNANILAVVDPDSVVPKIIQLYAVYLNIPFPSRPQ